MSLLPRFVEDVTIKMEAGSKQEHDNMKHVKCGGQLSVDLRASDDVDD